MKKIYKILLIILAAEFVVVSVMSNYGVTVKSFIGRTLGALIFLLPALILLFMLGRDGDLSDKKRLCARCGFWYLAICYIAGIIMELAAMV